VDELAGHLAAHRASVAHVRVCIHVLYDFGAVLADAEVAAWQADRVLRFRVTHHACVRTAICGWLFCRRFRRKDLIYLKLVDCAFVLLSLFIGLGLLKYPGFEDASLAVYRKIEKLDLFKNAWTL